MRKALFIAFLAGIALGCSESKPAGPTANEIKQNEERIKKAAKGEGG